MLLLNWAWNFIIATGKLPSKHTHTHILSLTHSHMHTCAHSPHTSLTHTHHSHTTHRAFLGPVLLPNQSTNNGSLNQILESLLCGVVILVQLQRMRVTDIQTYIHISSGVLSNAMHEITFIFSDSWRKCTSGMYNVYNTVLVPKHPPTP